MYKKSFIIENIAYILLTESLCVLFLIIECNQNSYPCILYFLTDINYKENLISSAWFMYWPKTFGVDDLWLNLEWLVLL